MYVEATLNLFLADHLSAATSLAEAIMLVRAYTRLRKENHWHLFSQSLTLPIPLLRCVKICPDYEAAPTKMRLYLATRRKQKQDVPCAPLLLTV
jgi:hypothetical protein